MTADDITVERLQSLRVLLDAATDTIHALEWEAVNGLADPAEAAAIVNETIHNLTNEAR
jgi:hypothetical protein